MATPSARGNAQKSAMDWVNERMDDPDVQAAMAEIDIRQDLIALREARGLTQVQLAQLIGVTQPMIAKIESQKGTRDVKLSTLVKVAAALGARVKITLEPRQAGAKRATRRKRVAA